MAKKAHGKSHREGLTIVPLMDVFPTDEAATAWFEDVIWPDGAMPEIAALFAPAKPLMRKCPLGDGL